MEGVKCLLVGGGVGGVGGKFVGGGGNFERGIGERTFGRRF